MAKSVQKISLSASRDIPFDKLVLSQSNVRHVKVGVSIDELAADIARRTLLQSLTVRPVLDHFRLAGNHQVWLRDTHPDQPLAIVIPLDDDLPLRVAGVLRLHRLITAKNAGPIPQSQALTAQRRKRLIQMLLALDGHFSQASYRELASALFGPSVTTEKGWKTHPIRARTIRLVNDAIKMVNRGYLTAKGALTTMTITISDVRFNKFEVRPRLIAPQQLLRASMTI